MNSPYLPLTHKSSRESYSITLKRNTTIIAQYIQAVVVVATAVDALAWNRGAALWIDLSFFVRALAAY